MFHIYRGNLLYHSISEGNWFPLLDPNWYNGAEIMRYWAPFPAYIMAFCQFLAGGDMFQGYIVFVGLMCFFGAIPWLAIGVSRNRIGLGAFLGALWFFMPNNITALCSEGNLARSICMIFLPLFIHYLHGYLYENKWSSLVKMMICSLFMVLCHLGYAGMIFLAVLIYLICYMVLYRNFRKAVHIILGIALTFLWTGIWTIASLKGGITSTDSSQVMATFFQDAWISLNPMEKLRNNGVFYFGLAAFSLSLFGLFFSHRKSMAGFAGGIIIFICTTTSMYPIISRLPGSQYLWMLRFISIALCFILFSFLSWDTLKKPIIVLICLLLLADTIPGLPLLCGSGTKIPVEERFTEFAETTLLREAKEITTQRLALLDLSSLEAKGAFVASTYRTENAASFGAGWQGANTATNIVQLNQAMEDGRYLYLFDRCLELGNDTILVKVNLLCNGEDDIDELDQAAATLNYQLVNSNENYRLYKIATFDSFGVVTNYRAIGIGTAAASFALVYPQVQEAESNNLNDYTFERLSQYQMIYLDGFTYSNRTEAEQLILKLSEAGTRIVISADSIPIDEHTGIQQFLDVYCYNIDFANGYPILDTIDGRLDLDLFPSGYTEWKTVYLEGLEDCWGYIEDKGKRLEFYGTAKNSNIMFVGLNLSYQCMLTKDPHTEQLLSRAMNTSITDLPSRTLVPISITYSGNDILIETEYDNVNTTIAFHDNLKSEQTIWQENHLTYVNAGITKISMHYPYLWQGLLVSLGGILASVFFLKWTKEYITYSGKRKKKNEDNEVKDREYQFKFYLNASHSMNMGNDNLGKKHSHTWEIAMTMTYLGEEFVQFHDAEETITDFLLVYQDKYLNETPPFDKINPILENMCEYFKSEIEERIQRNGWTLLRMVISETPTRSYVMDSSDVKEQSIPSDVEATETKAASSPALEEAAATKEEDNEIEQKNVEVKPLGLKKKNRSTISVILPTKKSKRSRRKPR